jgi:hypothetical protein
VVRMGRGFPMPVGNRKPRKAYFTSIGSGTPDANCSYAYANITHNIPVGTSALLVAANATYPGTAPVYAQIGGSTLLTLLGSYIWRGPSSGVFLWGMMNPPSGSQTIGVYVGTSSAYVSFNSFTYNNVSSFGTVSNSTGATSSMSQSVTATQTVFQMFGTLTGTSITNYFPTSRWISSSGNQLVAVGDSQGSATFTATTSVTPTYGWASAAVPLNAS